MAATLITYKDYVKRYVNRHIVSTFLLRRIAFMHTWKQDINLLFTEETLNHLVEW